jgi:maltose-binding protein MalE
MKEIFTEYVQKAVLGQMTAEEAMNMAARDIEQAIDKAESRYK